MVSVIGSGTYFNHDIILNGIGKEIKFRNVTNYVTLDAVNATTDTTAILPNFDGTIPVFTTAPTSAIADGTAGQVLTTDGAGALSFTTVANSSFTTDVTVTSSGISGSANLMLNNTETTNNFGKAIEAFRSGITTGKRHQILLGKDSSNNDTSTISYYYAGNASSNNRLEFGFWGADALLNVRADGNVGIGTTSPSTALDVNGTVTATAFAGTDIDINSSAGNVDIASIGGNVTLAGDTGDMTFTNTGTGVFSFAGGVAVTDSVTVLIADGGADNEYAMQIKNQEATDDRSYGLLILSLIHI